MGQLDGNGGKRFGYFDTEFWRRRPFACDWIGVRIKTMYCSVDTAE